MVGAGGTKDLNEPREQSVRADAHIDGLDGQPQGVDADHRSHSRNQAPQEVASCAGQSTTMTVAPRHSSR
jgi:hypothetical protein